ncbi:hypothetical protein GGI15_004888, partial [Coemansia interrupta]
QRRPTRCGAGGGLATAGAPADSRCVRDRHAAGAAAAEACARAWRCVRAFAQTGDPRHKV